MPLIAFWLLGWAARFSPISLIFSTQRTLVVGRSGIGKSTLLKIIAGIDKKYSGTIESNYKKIAYMFQEPRLLPWKTSLENVKAVLPSDKNHIAKKYFDAVGLSLDDDGNKFPDELSGGMKQRVSLARFLAYAETTDADCLILDEPFSALDEHTLDKVIGLIKKFATDKMLIISCHDKLIADRLDAQIIEI